jgi:hypothetical protein
MRPSEYIANKKADAISKSKNKNLKTENFVSLIESTYNDLLASLGKDEPNETTVYTDDNLRKSLETINETYFKDDNLHLETVYLKLKGTDYCRMLLEHYWNTLPEQIKKLIESGNVDVVMVEDEIPDVHVKHCEDNTHAIVLTSGLKQILYSILRTYATCLVTEEQNTRISFEETSSIIADDFYIFKKTYTIAPRKNVEVSNNQVVFATRLCMMAEMFYIFHEFAHIFINDTLEGDAELKTTPYDQELLADYFASNLCFTINKKWPPEFVYAGCECALLVFSMLEKLKLLRQSTTHPPFLERINSLRQLLKKDITNEGRYSKLISIGQITETIFNNITNNLNSQSSSYVDFITCKKELINTAIDKLLTTHWNGHSSSDVTYVCPNYAQFNEKMVELLNSGYYELIHDKLLSAITASLSETKLSGKTANQISKDTMCYFESVNKVKLIYGFVSSLYEPLATVFIDISKAVSAN